jgi:hypothetical protein
MQIVGPETSANEELTRYLLGEMSAEEQMQIELSYFADPQLFAELCAWRNQLIDSYVSGALSSSMRERFEAGIEKSWAMNERIRFAEALQETIKSRAVTEAAAQNQSGAWGRFRGFTAKYPYAIVIMPAVLLFVLWAGWQLLRPSNQAASVNAPGDLQTEQPNSIDKAAGAQTQPASETGPALPATGPSTANSVLMLTLSSTPLPGANDHSSELAISNDSTIVQLRLIVRPPPHRQYFAALKTPGAFEISRNNELPALPNANGTVVDLFVPADRLISGDYIVRLSGVDGGDKVVSAGDYYFRVRKN